MLLLFNSACNASLSPASCYISLSYVTSGMIGQTMLNIWKRVGTYSCCCPNKWLLSLSAYLKKYRSSCLEGWAKHLRSCVIKEVESCSILMVKILIPSRSVSHNCVTLTKCWYRFYNLKTCHFQCAKVDSDDSSCSLHCLESFRTLLSWRHRSFASSVSASSHLQINRDSSAVFPRYNKLHIACPDPGKYQITCCSHTMGMT